MWHIRVGIMRKFNSGQRNGHTTRSLTTMSKFPLNTLSRFMTRWITQYERWNIYVDISTGQNRRNNSYGCLLQQWGRISLNSIIG
ncbi:hypothetical protein BGW36DRAFT_381544 [Talaromyces proteolyticus]|uniref:Uncharacterized protein n=1 Tax=Talaromyces proteolyticus TaxID=1131652 RepID=A0AAD4KQB2_9EURO|nr:uncharacterized protein BGW36DRAFT_381544 [Talaromyces proteolyticus]KAH8696736.1 hypothetical protein BGW36DRAFT_381544 [Talaromyces proteolyticus]